MKRSARAMGWCTTDEKLLYVNRKMARKAAKEHPEHKSEYRCSANPGLWHIGGVPGAVIRGEMTRREYYGSAS
jgi:hypothetical protein